MRSLPARHSASSETAWAIPGMDSPWNGLIVDKSAPVDMIRTLRKSPFLSFPHTYPAKSYAEQPQPLPPL